MGGIAQSLYVDDIIASHLEYGLDGELVYLEMITLVVLMLQQR